MIGYNSGGARGSSSAECGVRPSHVSRSTKSRSLESTFARGGVSQRDSHVSYNEATNDLDEYMESVESDADIGELTDDSSMYDTNIGALTDDSSMFVSFTDSNASVNSLSWTSGSAKQLELAALIRSATLQQQSRAWEHHSSAPPGAFVTAATSPPLSEKCVPALRRMHALLFKECLQRLFAHRNLNRRTTLPTPAVPTVSVRRRTTGHWSGSGFVASRLRN